MHVQVRSRSPTVTVRILSTSYKITSEQVKISIKQVIQLNNKAVSLLESKRFSEDIPVSCAALEVFQKQTPAVEQGYLCGNDLLISAHFLAPVMALPMKPRTSTLMHMESCCR